MSQYTTKSSLKSIVDFRRVYENPQALIQSYFSTSAVSACNWKGKKASLELQKHPNNKEGSGA